MVRFEPAPSGAWTDLPLGARGAACPGRRRLRGGWNELSREARDSACPGVRRFNGTDYGAPTACGRFAGVSPGAPPAPTPADGALSQQRLFDWPEEPMPAVRALSPAERETLF